MVISKNVGPAATGRVVFPLELLDGFSGHIDQVDQLRRRGRLAVDA